MSGRLRLRSVEVGGPAGHRFRSIVQRSPLVLPAVIGLGLALSGAAAGAVRVVTTVQNLAALAREVGGERVEVEAIATGYQDPHYVHARPSFARLVNRADLLLANGLDLEVAWLPPLIESGRNPAVRPGTDGFLDASTAIESILEVPEGPVDRSGGDVHPHGNPHYDLDPRNGLRVASAIADVLTRLDPDGAAEYHNALHAYVSRLESRIADWEQRAEPIRGTPIITYHQQWEYLAAWLGLRIVDQIEDRPGIPPSPRHVAELSQQMKEEGIRLILAAPYNDGKQATRVAERGGGILVVVPTSVGGEDGIGTYEDLLDVIVSRLVEAADSLGGTGEAP